MSKFAKGYQEAINDAVRGESLDDMKFYASSLKGEYKQGYLLGLAKAKEVLK